MTKRQIFMVTATAFCATAILGQALPRMFPPQPAGFGSGAQQNEVRQFHIGAKAYRVTLAHDEIFASPAWQPSLPLPIDLAKVESIAREELRKVVADDSRWEVKDIGLSRLPQTLKPEWFYTIGLRPKPDGIMAVPDYFSEIITLSGKPGKIEPEGASR